MLLYILEKEITAETTLEVAQHLEDARVQGVTLQVVLNTQGGSVSNARLITRLLRENRERVHLVAGAGIYSAAFNIFANFDGRRSMVRGCRGMYHQSTQEVRLNGRGYPATREDACILNGLLTGYEEEYQMARVMLNTAELKEFVEGRDVYLCYERLCDIFPNVETI